MKEAVGTDVKINFGLNHIMAQKRTLRHTVLRGQRLN